MFLRGFKHMLAGFAALCLLAGPALSEVHNIMIFDLSYFPTRTHVQAGDTIVFRNESPTTHTVASKDLSWSTGPIAAGESATVTVQPLMFTAFFDVSGINPVDWEPGLDPSVDPDPNLNVMRVPAELVDQLPKELQNGQLTTLDKQEFLTDPDLFDLALLKELLQLDPDGTFPSAAISGVLDFTPAVLN